MLRILHLIRQMAQAHLTPSPQGEGKKQVRILKKDFNIRFNKQLYFPKRNQLQSLPLEGKVANVAERRVTDEV